MGECIFCLIAQGKIPSSKIYETDSLYAFLDLNPVHKGHTLIIPKNTPEIFLIWIPRWVASSFPL